MNQYFKDWQTTIFGTAAGALSMLANTPSGATPKQIGLNLLTSLAMGGLGYFAAVAKKSEDSNK